MRMPIPCDIMRNVALVIPVLADSTFLIAHEYRSNHKRRMYGLFGGAVEKGEDPVAAGLRELKEESGYSAGKATHLASFTLLHPKLVFHVVLAEDLSPGERALEPEEDIDVINLNGEKVLSLIRSGEMSDCVSVAALLYYFGFGKVHNIS
jgi:ADP-ribose pyrophosphatase